MTAHAVGNASSRGRSRRLGRCTVVIAAAVAAVLAGDGTLAPCRAQVGAEIAPGGPGAVPSRPGATGGEVLYMRYCASCHGVTGHGDGPVARELRKPPPDLTRLAARNGGKFDERSLVAVIDGRRSIAAHGGRAMPVWGDVFDTELAGAPHAQRQSLLRSTVLVDWLRSIQER